MTHILDNYLGTELLARARRVPKHVLQQLYGNIQVPDALVVHSPAHNAPASSCNCNCNCSSCDCNSTRNDEPDI